MEDIFIIVLTQIGDGNADGGYHNRNDGGKIFPQVLVDDSDDNQNIQVKGKLMAAIHGTMEPDGDPASLLIFEFDLTTPKSRRFEKATIRVTFEDSRGPSKSDPEVHRVGPRGMFAINKQTETGDVSYGYDAAINANPIPALGLNAGYHWSMSKMKTLSHSATLNGMSRRVKPNGEETTAVWAMEEDSKTKGGIPTFLRTAVILRHDPDEPRQFTINLEIEAFEKSWIFGKTRLTKMHDPMYLDPDIWARVKKEGLEAENLGEMDLGSRYVVRIAKALDVE